MLLVGFRNRVVVLVNWAWNYVNYNNGLRLIVRPYVNHLKRETSAELIE
jgi:NADH dehydrogenase